MFRRSHCYFVFPLGCPVIATPPCLPCGVDWDTQSFTLAFIQWLVWDPVASFSRSILILLILETRLPHSVMWCALFVCHHQCRRRRTERTDSSGFFSRGCTVLPEGNGGESFRGPFREKPTKTERIDADFCLDLCGEWTWHQRWHAKHAPKWMTHACMRGKRFTLLSNMHVNLCCIGSDAFCSCLSARGQSWSSIQSRCLRYSFSMRSLIFLAFTFMLGHLQWHFFTRLFVRVLKLFHSINWLCMHDNWRTSQVGIAL